jgi:mRNA interferase RelE/StbE
MAVKFRKQAIKFLQKASSSDVTRIQNQIRQLLVTVEEQGVIPFTDLDIKKMKGEWEGFYRLRISKFRIIFTVSLASADIEIYAIGARGDVYNK